MLSFTQLTQRRIVDHADAATSDLNREMEIADRPSQARSGRGIAAQWELQNWFRLLRDLVEGILRLSKNVAVCKRVLEIKAKLQAVRRDAAPAPLGESVPVNREHHFVESGVPLVKVIVDDLHLLEKEVALSHWQDSGRFTAELPAIGLDRVSFGIHFDPWKRVVPDEVTLADRARVADCGELLA